MMILQVRLQQRNTYKYTKIYSGQDPQFIEGDVFRITVPIPDIATATVGPVEQSDLDGTRNPVIKDSDFKQTICKLIEENPRTTIKEFSQILGISVRTLNRKLKEIDDVIFVGKDKNGHWEILSNKQ